MYFLAGSEACLKLIPALAVTSSSCGMGRPLHLMDLAPGGGGGGVGWPSCPRTRFAATQIRKNILVEYQYRYLLNRSPSSRLTALHGLHSGFLALFCLQFFIYLKLTVGVGNSLRLAVGCLQLIVHIVGLRAESGRGLQMVHRLLQLSTVQQNFS